MIHGTHFFCMASGFGNRILSKSVRINDVSGGGRLSTKLYGDMLVPGRVAAQDVPVSFLVSDVISQLSRNCHIVSFLLTTGLWVVRGRCHAFASKYQHVAAKKLAHEFRVIIG